MVGKTRMAAEVVKEMFPDRPILVPDRKGALAALDAADIELRSCVIWLDDLDRLLGADGISEGAPRRLAATGNAVVATMRASQYESYVPTNLFRPPEWEVIADFERIVVRRELNEAEDRRLAELVGHELTRSQIRRTGIGEFVGASDRVAEQLKLGPVTDPVGYALVRGAADWFRMGIREPIPPDLLSSLASPPIRLGDDADRARYQAALAWATRDINPTVSLLVREQDGYVVFDFALDEFVRSGEPILDATWQLGIEHASAADLVQLGIRAVRPFQRIDIGERAWRRAADAGDTDAMVLLGALLVDRHEDSAGDALFRAAAQAGNPRAMSQLGAFFRVRRRDPVRAEHWLRQAAERQQTRAAIELGMLLEQRGDLQQAERWYRVAAAAGEEIAMFRLGMALEARGDLDQAERWYREAADSGSITASLALAVVQKRRGQAGHGLPSAEAEAGERAVEPLGQHPDRALPDHGADRR